MSSNPQSRAEVKRYPRVVLALPESKDLKTLADTLHRAGYLPHRTPSPETATLAVAYRDPAAILVDASFLKSAGYRFLDSLRMTARDVPVFVLADREDEQVRLRALMLGAEDCLVRPFAPQEAVLRIRRAVERAITLKSIEREREETNRRAEGFKEEAGALRTELRRNVSLLQRATDFHQRLELEKGLEATAEDFLRHLSVQVGVDRLAFLAPSHSGGSWLVPRATLGIPSWMAERIRIPGAGELTELLESTGAPMVVERVTHIPSMRLEAGILTAGGITAGIPLLSKGGLSAMILLGEARNGGVPDQESLRLTHFLASALAPALALIAPGAGSSPAAAQEA